MKKKHILVLLSVISIIVLLVQMTYTYSLFETNRDAVIISPIAKWKIMVNDIIVTNNIVQENSFQLGSVLWDNNNHVREGKAAPGSLGTFEVTIDPTDTEVSFLYEISIDTSNVSNEEFFVSEVRELGGNEFIKTGEFTYVGIAHLDDNQNGTVYNIEIDLSWNNNEGNNRNDYELGKKASDGVNIPVSLRFIQYTGDEEIIPYVEESG